LLKLTPAVLVVALVCHGDRPAARRAGELETVVQGTPFEHVFTVPNTGSTPLVIQRVSTSSGVVTHVDSVIPPDSAGRVAVRIDLGSFVGVLSEAVRVEFAGHRPAAEFRVLRRVVPLVEVAPQPDVYFFTARGEPAQRELTIINHLPRPLNVLDVASSNPAFRPTVKPLEPGRRYQLTITLDTTTAVGQYQGVIRITTDVREHASLTVEGHAYVKDVVNASLAELDYSQLDFNALDREAVGQRTVLVQKYRGTDFRILQAVTDVPFMTVKVEPQKDGESYFVHVRIQQDRAPRGRFHGALRIETNDVSKRELKLPIHGEIL